MWSVLIPDLSLWCSLSPSPRKAEDLNIELKFSLQYLICFQKYPKQSDWHLSHLSTILLCPGEEVCAKEYLGFEPIYFKLDFSNAGLCMPFPHPRHYQTICSLSIWLHKGTRALKTRCPGKGQAEERRESLPHHEFFHRCHGLPQLSSHSLLFILVF